MYALQHLLFPLLVLLVIVVAFPFLDRNNPAHRRYVAFFAFVLFVRYIVWYVQHSVMMTKMPTTEGFWLWVCFINEIFIFIETGTFYLLLCQHTDRKAQADRYERILRATPAKDLPLVDVFIPTYNEGIDVLERSIIGAMHLDWPKDKLQIWVLDDGKRAWLREFCEYKKVGYICRSDNVHAKAGNINHASHLTKGKFIVTLDADFVPYKQFIYRTLGFFLDPKVAIVQTPQHFFNKDFVQANLHLHDTTPDEQRLFFDVMMPARDGWDAAFWCGSCSVTRRTAMEKCGGVPTESITEDLLTTLTLLRHGYKTRYLNEKLSHGIAPEDLAGLMTQRERWCRGTIQAFYSKMGPLGAGLTLVQRILFFPTYWLFSPITRIMSHVVPIVFLWTGLPSVYIDHYSVLISYQIPVVLLNFAFELWVMPHHFMPIVNTASNTLNSLQVFPTVIHSLIKPFKRNFAVTPKGKFHAVKKKRFYHPYSFWVTLILLSLNIGGILVALNPNVGGNQSDGFFPIAASWAGFNTMILLCMLFLSVEHPKKRQEERFVIYYPSTIAHGASEFPITIDDMSLSGARLSWENTAEYEHFLSSHAKQKNVLIDLFLHGHKIPGRIVGEGQKAIKIQFLDLTLEQRHHVIEFLYTGRFNNAPRAQSMYVLMKNLFKRAFGRHEHLYN